MFEELAIMAYIPVIFGLKWYVDSLPTTTKIWLANVLEIPCVFWYMSLSIFSGFGTYYTGRFLVDNFVLNKNYRIHGSDVEFWYYAFISSKIPEFIDTLFIVGRSKPLVKLQYIHHLLTSIICYFAKPMACDMFTWFFFLNYFVHFFMYLYFAMYPFFKSVMKVFGTFVNFIQTAQMFIALCITIYYYNNFDKNDCLIIPHDDYFNKMVYFGLLMYTYYAYLFVQLWFERTERINLKSNRFKN